VSITNHEASVYAVLSMCLLLPLS